MKILIVGGNRFFGLRLAQALLEEGEAVTLLNRQTRDDGLGSRVTRLRCDRTHGSELERVLGDQTWDVIYDQVCFSAPEARDAAKSLAPRTKHYIFTSTEAVYGLGADLREIEFDPKTYTFEKDVRTEDDYSEGKRQCEAVLTREIAEKLTSVRFPIVIGEDDYTNRLRFHIERIRDGREFYVPNLSARISFISSTDAAAVLAFLRHRDPVGPVNAASREPIAIGEILKMIGTPRLIHEPSEVTAENHSPYGIPSDWWMNVDRLKEIGFEARPVREWLPGVIAHG